MTNDSRKYIKELVAQVFQNRWDQEYKVLQEQLRTIVADANARGVLRSSFAYSKFGRLHGEFFFRVISQTLDQGEVTFRQAGRRDGDVYWTTVNTELQLLVEAQLVRLNSIAVDFTAKHARNDASAGSFASQGFREFGDQAIMYIVQQTRELSLRSQVVTMKSSADRKAEYIPDVAVMMWFPTEGTDAPEAVSRAKEKYATIVSAVNEATNGLATVNKIDDPQLVHKDRISPSVEVWLTKSVLVICDLEGNRPNVFYEFGYARAVGTDIIATIPSKEEAAFHLRQWQMDIYADMAELKAKITPRIATVLSRYDLSGTI